ncbi:TolC family protein [Psychroserpens sp.]|uniref:TolC family protein n=1 Tax=Psychroserpens sp. TaxID=2020870 RepID=UPI001B25A910|nr:TolC family protein [Psychroserpens sp.]MBO6607774.1 TolC family protein [Psychroserpens sp.]MBO6654765.1 TolC family protein [Psychroserpens sp.]MBO6682811.1 TolC family protein [Psychroserpens sp.]MBO6751132.1 TolC family protein [Psychroserpens sp.]MBO6916299.1 TolC family protein [Psychroserpens sp.]
MKPLSIIILLLFSSLGFSQDAQASFSLQEAIDYALENNRQAQNASRDIEAARQQKWEATATGLPQIDANINYQNFLKQQVSVVPAEFFGGNPGEFAEVIFGTQQNAAATATLNQMLFDGSYIVGLQSAKVFLEISENAKIKTDLEVRKAVINAYGNVLLAKESVKIAEKNKEILQKNLNETTKIYENGLEELESVEQLQITLSNITSFLNNAVRLEVIAIQMLNITLGIDYNTDIILTDDLESLALRNMDGSMLLESNDVTSNIDYIIAENDTESKALMLKLERSRALPTLNAFINGSYTAFDNDFVFFDSGTKWFGASLFGLNLDIPIFSSGKRSAASQRARINLEIAQTELKETEQRLQLQIASAKSDYKFAIEDYENKKQNLDLAERIEKKNQTKFFEGIGSSFELRQAQTQLYTAQQELLQAMLDVINTKTDLETVLNKPKNN